MTMLLLDPRCHGAYSRPPCRRRAVLMHACFLDLPEVGHPEPAQGPPGPDMMVLRQAQGGPAPFGLGQGITQLEEISCVRPLLPRPQDAELATQRRAQQELRRIARALSQPIEHLSPQDQRAVQEERLRLMLGKFWGLMHELDRPWHRPLIIRLCCQLPAPCRDLYRRLKPSSLQRVISTRAQAEKQLHDLHSQALSIRSRTARLIRQERLGAQPKTQELQDMLARVIDLKSDTGRVQSVLQVLMYKAQVSFSDQEYGTYCDGQLLPVTHQLSSWCDMFMSSLRKSMLGAGQQARKGRTKGAGMTADWLATAPCTAYQEVTWQYPPATYLSKGRSAELKRPLGSGASAERVPQLLDVRQPSSNDSATWFVDLDGASEEDDEW